LVIDPSERDCPELDSDGVRPTNAPMLEPVNRCQSPISTASPNTVSVDTPRRQPTRSTTGSELAVRSHRLDRRVEPVATAAGQRNRFAGGLERSLSRRQVERLAAQPPIVRPGPRRPTAEHDPVAACVTESIADDRARMNIKTNESTLVTH
jgi:hypothetical protein